MSPGVSDVVLALYAAGMALTVAASLAALSARGVLTRLHFLTPITSAGAPLIGLALAIQDGWGLTGGQIVLIVALLAVTGPVLEVATGRVAAQRQGSSRCRRPTSRSPNSVSAPLSCR